ncbi:MAG: CRTAC1 family protein [Woeseia sp.]
MSSFDVATRQRFFRAVAIFYVVLLNPAAVFASVQFDDLARFAGVDEATESYGASWGDLNGDGYPDLFVSNHRKQPTVYVNMRDGTFRAIDQQVVPWVNRSFADTHGGTWADFDNDGDQDLIITTGTGNDMQFLVNERGDLVDRTAELGVEVNNVGGRLAMWLDYNRDGLMDFIAIQFGGVAQLFRQTSTGFVNDTIGSNVVCDRVQYGHLLDTNGDRQLDIVCAHDARFPRKIYDTSYYPLIDITSTFPVVRSVADSIVADFNNNGEMDVFFLSNTQLRTSGASQASARKVEALLSNGDKGLNFVSPGPVTVELSWNRIPGVKTSPTPFEPIIVGANGQKLVSTNPFTLDSSNPAIQGIPPYDPSLAPVLRIGYDTSASPARWVFIIDSVNASGKQVFSEAYLQITGDQNITGLETSGMWAGDSGGVPTLMMNNGSAFNNATAGSGLDEEISCVSAVAGDFDNDGDVDLYLACRTGAANIANRYYDNDGTGRFTLVANAGGAEGPIGTNVADGAGTADSVVVADYDNDGFLDLFVNNGFNLRPKGYGGPSNLFRNLGNNNRWLQLDLVGTRGTREALGARVQVTAQGLTQTRAVDGGYHRWSQNHGRIHFGLGSANAVDVSIRWPDGTIENHNNVAANAFYTATEGGALVATPPGRGVPYACGEPSIDAAVDHGVYVWKECYLSVWRVRFAAGGERQRFEGQIAADAPISTVNSVGWGNVLNLSDPETLVFEVTEANARLKGFNLIPGAGATRHCLTLQSPAGTPIFYGPLKERVLSPDLLFEYGLSCAHVPDEPPPADPTCGDPGLDPATEAGIALWKNCPGNQWQMRAQAGGLGWTVYKGTIDSSTGFASWEGYDLESADKLELSSSTRLAFSFGMVSPFIDGLKFIPNANSSTCFTLNVPAGADIAVGASGIRPAGNSFSLTTLDAC